MRVSMADVDAGDQPGHHARERLSLLQLADPCSTAGARASSRPAGRHRRSGGAGMLRGAIVLLTLVAAPGPARGGDPEPPLAMVEIAPGIRVHAGAQEQPSA